MRRLKPSLGDAVTSFLRMFAASLLLAAVSAPAPACAQTVVRMWTLLGGGDGERMRALVEQFNACQKEAKVEVTTLNWGEPFYTKLITSTVVGAGPDLATVHLSRMTNLAGGGVLRPITPGELQAAGLRGADFSRASGKKPTTRASCTACRSTCIPWYCISTSSWRAAPDCSTRAASLNPSKASTH